MLFFREFKKGERKLKLYKSFINIILVFRFGCRIIIYVLIIKREDIKINKYLLEFLVI